MILEASEKMPSLVLNYLMPASCPIRYCESDFFGRNRSIIARMTTIWIVRSTRS